MMEKHQAANNAKNANSFCLLKNDLRILRYSRLKPVKQQIAL